MKDFIENVLHQEVRITSYEHADKLPLSCRSEYEFSLMVLNGRESLLAAPVHPIPLAALRRQHRQIELHAGLDCVLCLQNMNSYSRDEMIREGIPFIREGRQISLPSAGILLDGASGKKILPCARISFLAQRLLLCALHQNRQSVTVTKAADLLGVSKMSVSRSIDELEALEVPYLSIRSRGRNFSTPAKKRNVGDDPAHAP